MKLIVVGPSMAGKSSCIQKYVRNEFHPSYRPTIGVDFFLKEVVGYRHEESMGNRSQNIHIHMWDIAGQERFGSMSRTFYREAVGAIIVADCTSPKSLQEAIRWKKDIDSKVCIPNADGDQDIPVPCILFVNKDDLLPRDANTSDEMEPMVSEEMVQHLNEVCSEHGFLRWIFTSAMTGHNIEEGIMTMVDHVFNAGLMRLPMVSTKRQDAIVLGGDHGRSLKFMNSHGEIQECDPLSDSDTPDEFYSDKDWSYGVEDYTNRSRCCG